MSKRQGYTPVNASRENIKALFKLYLSKKYRGMMQASSSNQQARRPTKIKQTKR